MTNARNERPKWTGVSRICIHLQGYAMTTTLTADDFARTTDFVWRTARLIDRLRFAYHFLNGSREAVVTALRPYQNADGGFGNAIEPDLRAPLSQPVPTQTGLGILDEIGAFDDPMVGQACDYLVTITTEESGIPFVLPSSRPYPHAVWWETEDNPPAAVNPTAAIAGLLHKNGTQHPWLEPATAFCWKVIEAIDETSPYDMRAILPFLEHVPDRERAERAMSRLGPKLFEQNLVALDPNTPGGHTPLDYAPRPTSIARRLFSDEMIDRNLDALVEMLKDDGGWKVNWDVWSPMVGLEWRGVVTVDVLQTLRAHGRL
jgi:hypothetical protein